MKADNAAKMLGTPRTLMEAIKFFSDPDIALAYMSKIVWPNGPTCLHCGSQKVSFIATRRIWKCSTCPGRKQFSIKVGTVMEDSPLPIDKWLAAMWMEANSKNSISSYEIHRALGITQKSAWFMLHRIRFAIKQKTFTKMGRNGVPVESDETFIGGLSKFMHAKKRAERITGRGQTGKAVVMGLLERHSGKKHSTVRAMVLPKHPSKDDIRQVIHKNVEPGAHLMTDEAAAYQGLQADFEHQFVDHANKYVDGVIHTNGLENFWSLFKRCIKGTHVSVEPHHLLAYVDSEAYRFNNRKTDDANRFVGVLKNVSGKRLDYRTLIGKNDSVPLS
jgi:transposase-like protein